MSVLRLLLNFYLESSIHVALAVLSFTLMSYYGFNLKVDTAVLGFVFFGTITGYNLVKYAPIAGLYHRSLTRHLKVIQIFSGFAFIGMLYFFSEISNTLKMVSVALAMLTVLYALPFYRSKSLRNLSGIKIYIVALVWAGVTVILPYSEYGKAMPTTLLVAFIQRFLWVIALTLPFEVRDLAFDRRELGTIPQKLGINKTKVLGIGLLMLIILLGSIVPTQDTAYFGSKLFFILLTGVMLLLARTNRSRWYTAFWVEAIPIFWLLGYWLIRYFFSS